MKIKKLLFLIPLIGVFGACSNKSDKILVANYDITNNQHLRKIGRYQNKEDGVRFALSYSGFEMKVENSDDKFEIHLLINNESSHQFINVYLDDEFVLKQEIGIGKKEYGFVFEKEKGEHYVSFNKLNEYSYPFTLENVGFASCEPYLIKNRNKPIIEFYGDSITCGYGNLAQSNIESFKVETQDASQTYAVKAAEIIGYEPSLVSFSGMALAMSPFGNGRLMLDCYDTMDSVNKFDLSTYKPDIYVINLGTNDNTKYNTLMANDKPGMKDLYKTNMITLMNNLFAINNDAKMVVCYNMMTSINMDLILAMDAAYKEVIVSHPNQISFLQFEGDRSGANGHPSAKGHDMFGNQLAEHLLEKLGRYQ